MTIVDGTVTLHISYEGFFADDFIDNDEKVLVLKNIPRSRQECKTDTPFMTKVSKTDNHLMTRTLN